MPDITSVLERAAAAPSGAPDVDGPIRRKRWTRATIVATACVLVLFLSVLLVPRGHARVVVSTPPTPPTTLPAPTSATSHGATITVPAGWYASKEPLNWWISSPFELFSISTSPLPASPHVAANEAACPAEIPQ